MLRQTLPEVMDISLCFPRRFIYWVFRLLGILPRKIVMAICMQRLELGKAVVLVCKH